MKVVAEIISPISNQFCGVYLITISSSPVSLIQKQFITEYNGMDLTVSASHHLVYSGFHRVSFGKST